MQGGICTATYLPSLNPSKSDEQDTRNTAGGVRTNLSVTFFYEPYHMDEQA